MKQKFKINLINRYFYPVAAGVETNILKTYSTFSKESFSITVHTSTDTLTQKNLLKKNDSISGLKVKRYSFSALGFFPKINWEKTDLVCLHDFNIFPYARILLYVLYLKLIRKKNFGLFLTPHGGFTPEWSMFPGLMRYIKKIYHYTLGVILINLVVDGVRAVSNWELERLRERGIRRDLLEVISNGVEEEAFGNIEKSSSPKIKKEVKKFGKYLIQIGRIHSIKNYETTIKALSRLPENINYVIAGPEDRVLGEVSYKENLVNLINELGLQKRVFFAGVVEGFDKYYLIKNAQMMVHMALWESFCNVVHEGLSQGLVCIVANNTALPYLIKNGVNGYLVETKDHDVLAERINFVLRNKNSRFIKEMKAKNILFCRDNAWRKVAARMREFYFSKREYIPKDSLKVGGYSLKGEY